MRNSLAGEMALTREQFRQKHRAKQKEIDWLEGGSFLKLHQTPASTTYRLEFLGFAMLVCVRTSRAEALRVLMDKILRLVKRNLANPELTNVTSIPLGNLASRINHGLPECHLRVALRILSTSSIGVHMHEPTTGAESVNYSDSVYHVSNMLGYSLHFVRGYGARARASLFSAPEAPLSLTKLQLVPDAYTNAKNALDRVLGDPSSAIGSAKSALEGVLKMVAVNSVVQVNPSLPQLVKACQADLRLDGEFVDLGRTVTTLVQRIAEIRNVYSDGHGKAPGQRGATQAEAKFVVGTTLLLCDFLLERWEAAATMKSQV
ncbi:abortive infection family protein [Hydrogenophaga palleronii]|uniref:abortive infection family protein n=1 Tax=Hydrogenophaga palleronii TaxID=65655 RepID=UPI00147182C1|nr:abortive infection family protein [Hydrogenophaga palleronii]